MTGSLFIAFLYRLELKVAEIRHEGTECVISGKFQDFFIFSLSNFDIVRVNGRKVEDSLKEIQH